MVSTGFILISLFLIVLIIGIVFAVIYIKKNEVNITWTYNNDTNTEYIYTVGTPITPLIPSYKLFDNFGVLKDGSDSSTLPEGLTIDSTTGIISGTPTEVTSKSGYLIIGSGINRAGNLNIYITVNP